VVSGVTPFGIFVQLDQLFVEGLVHVTGLGQDYFQYDEARHELRGERSGQVYQLTSRVTVQVAKVDLESRKIDLVLAQSAQQEAVPAPLERARAAAQEGSSSKPPRRRKAKGGNGVNGGISAPMAVSPQEARGTPAEPPAASFNGNAPGEDDVVFVPPTRRGRKNASKAPKAVSKTSKKKQ
jgi:ribonuclease R